jgi:Ser/Thr protein kinase RdoA (MazF antagonist)
MASETCAPATDWLSERLPRHLWRDGEPPSEIVAVRVAQVHERAKQTTAVYHLTLRTPAAEVVEQSYVGYVSQSRKRLRADYDALTVHPTARPQLGRPIVLLPEANLILVACPTDPEMGELFSAEDLGRWIQHPARARALGMPDSERVKDTQVMLLRYMPGKRATSRCRVRLVDSAGRERVWSCIAKQFADRDKARRLYMNLLDLEQSWPQTDLASTRNGYATGFTLRLPRALGYSRPKALVFIEEVAGRELSGTLGEIDVDGTMAAVGKLLARLHLTPPRVRKRVRKRVSRQSELDDTREVLAGVGGAFPRLREQAGRLLETLAAAPLDTRPSIVLLHGSYRLNHVLIDGTTLTLLDLDGFRVGDAACDLATFLSSLHQAEVDQRLDADVRRRVARAFLRGYAAAMPWSLDAADLLWFLANLLINKQARKYLLHDETGREAKVGRMLALADQALATAARLPPAAPIEELGPPAA